ncbi:hypothetical protein [Actinophytocola sp.]|uniref:hypothetical protein n=1 Tax=Actinophytocola sp. TaxID=1872138 RepID=UPI002D80FBD0|nr:hypothetical protein [Actinophytocola sp.]HET9142974.1 hypothetical protein [Actinophytocola sp.]
MVVVELCGAPAIAILAALFRNRRALTAARLVEELTEAANRLPEWIVVGGRGLAPGR